MINRLPRPTLCPYTTLFRSRVRGRAQLGGVAFERHQAVLQHDELRLVGLGRVRSEEHTSELQSLAYLVCRLLLEKKILDGIITTIMATIQRINIIGSREGSR